MRPRWWRLGTERRRRPGRQRRHAGRCCRLRPVGCLLLPWLPYMPLHMQPPAAPRLPRTRPNPPRAARIARSAHPQPVAAPLTIEAAHKKGSGSTKNGRDSVSKRRGVKVYGGQPVNAGGIIIRQLGTKVRAAPVWHCSARGRLGGRPAPGQPAGWQQAAGAAAHAGCARGRRAGARMTLLSCMRRSPPRSRAYLAPPAAAPLRSPLGRCTPARTRASPSSHPRLAPHSRLPTRSAPCLAGAPRQERGPGPRLHALLPDRRRGGV